MKYFTLFTAFLFLPLFFFAQSSDNLNLVGSIEFNAEGNDVWGYVDDTGREFALVGLTTGFSVVDLANPSTPTELFFIPGDFSTWRDVKVWDHYAYVTTDEGNDGLLIVDLNDLSGNTFTYTLNDNNGDFMFERAHNIYIDEFGKAYVFGGNINAANPFETESGALILDVTQVNLEQGVLPTKLGLFSDFYLHDGMARGDTLWGSAIEEGNFFVIDVSDPTNPVVFNDSLAFHPTPNNFTHNCWISDDGKTLFTTDEKPGAYIAAYDVSDLSNIQEVDRIRSSDDIGGVIPHNVHVDGNFLVTSYYHDGIVVHDATYPNNLIEVAHYDAYAGGGDGFQGTWGAYPYLPSGLILSSEINSSPSQNGMLLVLERDFNQASYLNGIVKDSLTGEIISGVSIKILGSNVINSSTNLFGEYFTGTANAGLFDVEYNKIGYFADTIEVNFQNGILNTQNISLLPEVSFEKSGQIVDIDGIGIPFSNIYFNSGYISHESISDENGFFNVDTLFEANYTVVAGKWSYNTICENIFIQDDSVDVIVVLEEGYYDDFSFDNGWVATGDANSGLWELAVPNPTTYENITVATDKDVDIDCRNKAYVSGNSLSGGATSDDIDQGYIKLTSPQINLMSFNEPILQFYQWFVNVPGWDNDANDSLVVMVSNGEEEVKIVTESATVNSDWELVSINLLEYISLSDEMYVSFYASDYEPYSNLLEVGVDLFSISENSLTDIHPEKLNTSLVYPNPTSGVMYFNEDGQKIIFDSMGKIMLNTFSKKIDLSHLSTGIYIVVFENGSSQRFIKN